MSRKPLLIAAFIICSLTLSSAVIANTGFFGVEWQKYTDASGIFQIQIPANYKTEYKTFRTGAKQVAYSGSVISSVDQRPYKPGVKIYNVKYEQSIGPGLGKDYITRFIKRDYNRTMDSLTKSDVTVEYAKETQIGVHSGYEYLISYKDPEAGDAAVRTRFIYTDSTRLEQTMSGPASIIEDTQSDLFFDSLKVMSGVRYQQGSYDKDWQHTTSKLGYFKTYHPKESSIYFPVMPKNQTGETTEKMRMMFHDPMWEYSTFYNIYAYEFKNPVSDERVKTILTRGHIMRQNIAKRDFEFTKVTKGGLNIMKNETVLGQNNQNFPYVDTLRLKAMYAGNVVIVQELIGNHIFTRSRFMDDIMGLTTLNPAKLKTAQSGNKAKPQTRSKLKVDFD
jgi:hypothetical protein